jgi:hypothetical protein
MDFTMEEFQVCRGKPEKATRVKETARVCPGKAGLVYSSKHRVVCEGAVPGLSGDCLCKNKMNNNKLPPFEKNISMAAIVSFT